MFSMGAGKPGTWRKDKMPMVFGQVFWGKMWVSYVTYISWKLWVGTISWFEYSGFTWKVGFTRFEFPEKNQWYTQLVGGQTSHSLPTAKKCRIFWIHKKGSWIFTNLCPMVPPTFSPKKSPSQSLSNHLNQKKTSNSLKKQLNYTPPVTPIFFLSPFDIWGPSVVSPQPLPQQQNFQWHLPWNVRLPTSPGFRQVLQNGSCLEGSFVGVGWGFPPSWGCLCFTVSLRKQKKHKGGDGVL